MLCCAVLCWELGAGSRELGAVSWEERTWELGPCFESKHLEGAVVWCGVVWCGVVWCGVVACGVLACGVV